MDPLERVESTPLRRWGGLAMTEHLELDDIPAKGKAMVVT